MKLFPILTAVTIVASVHGVAQSVFPVRDEGESRDRSYHVVHYNIDIAINGEKKMIEGKVTTTLVPFLPEFSTIDFDAEQMQIHRVTLGGRPLQFTVLPKTLAIHLPKTYSYDDTITVAVEYSCTPKKGLYFVQPDSGYPRKPWQVWSQGEDMDNHFWFPCYDFPNDFSTSELTATVPDKYTVLSNGRLVSVSANKRAGTKTFHWSEGKPHVTYLTTIAVGDYAILHDRAGSLPVEYYVYPSDTADAWACFRETPAMIKFFDEKIGFPFAWEKYAQVIVRDFIEGGMENASATTLMDDIAVLDARARHDESSTSLIAHELAHQWWGDVVTCKDWRHIWLNESFASYFDPLFQEYSQGRDEFDYTMYRNQQAGIHIDAAQGRKPIVSVGSFTTNVYPRGSAVLHMLRFVLGDKPFWRAIHHYITSRQFTPVETNDLRNAIEEATGKNLYWFFNEWLYKAGHPVFDVSYQWSDSAKAVLLSVKQTQKLDSLTGVFRTPVDIELSTPEGSSVQRITIETQDTTVVLPSPAKPRMVIFDKRNWMLKELDFHKSREEWEYQAEHATDAIDRYRALTALGEMASDTGEIPLLSRLMSRDPFWAVRLEATTALGRIPADGSGATESIKSALLAAAGDAKSAVRAAAIGQLRTFHGNDVIAKVHAALKDSSYNVVASALRTITKVDSANAEPILLANLDVPSFHNTITNTALFMLASIDSARAMEAAFVKARYGEHPYTRFTALNILARHGKGRHDVIDLFRSMIHDKNRFIQSDAIRSLGDIGDESAVPALQALTTTDDEHVAKEAQQSIEKIQKRIEGTK